MGQEFVHVRSYADKYIVGNVLQRNRKDMIWQWAVRSFLEHRLTQFKEAYHTGVNQAVGARSWNAPKFHPDPIRELVSVTSPTF